MELCGHGDAEDLIRDQPDALLPLSEAKGFLFQMAFSLYAARAELSLRHFDVKLLNFFVGDASQLVKTCSRHGYKGGEAGRVATYSTERADENCSRGGAADIDSRCCEDDVAASEYFVLRYGIGEEVMELRMPRDRAFVVSGLCLQRRQLFVLQRFRRGNRTRILFALVDVKQRSHHYGAVGVTI